MLDLFVPFRKFNDRTESVTKKMCKNIVIHDYLIDMCIDNLPYVGMLFCPATEWDSVVLLSPLGNLVTQWSLPQGTVTCLSPQGMLGLLSPLENLVTERSLPQGTVTCLSP